MVAPHRSNPGGHLDPQFVVGRDRLISNIWSTLEQQSVYMTAERRIGKTHIMYKMCKFPQGNWTTKFFDLEGVGTAEEFARQVWEGISEHLSKWNRTTRRARGVWDAIKGVDVGGVAGMQLNDRSRSWKDLLTSAVEDLEAEKVDRRLLFFFDEMTYMIQRISQNEGRLSPWPYWTRCDSCGKHILVSEWSSPARSACITCWLNCARRVTRTPC